MPAPDDGVTVAIVLGLVLLAMLIVAVVLHRGLPERRRGPTSQEIVAQAIKTVGDAPSFKPGAITWMDHDVVRKPRPPAPPLAECRPGSMQWWEAYYRDVWGPAWLEEGRALFRSMANERDDLSRWADDGGR